MNQKSPFTLHSKSSECHARRGEVKNKHGLIQTPVFMPVGTQGTVKAVTPDNLKEMGAQIILGNTYHLYIRPGHELIEQFGGLHGFMNWDGSILTDSGGFQIFSLKELAKITEEGAAFRSHIDGSKLFLSPEDAVYVQQSLGSDIMMVLDTCIPYPADRDQAQKATDLTTRWAKRCREAHTKRDQLLFGIVQGGMYEDIRKEHAAALQEIGFDGYALGGLSVGEEKELMYDMTEATTPHLPEEYSRYLMGVGTPEDLVEGVWRGIDMFDCVMPTRNARNGQLFTTKGKINLRNAKYKLSDDKIDDNIESYASNNFSLGYLHHLIRTNEILGLQLATMHNIAFYLWLAKTAREKIESGEFTSWKNQLINEMG